MREPDDEPPVLPYAGRMRSDAGSVPRELVVMAWVNGLAGLASLHFVSLAAHIYSCSSGQKWCHLQAFVFGVPAAVVVLVLVGFTAMFTSSIGPGGRRWRGYVVAAWSPLVLAAAVLAALLVSVLHNS